MNGLHLDYGLLVFVSEQMIGKQSQQLRPQLDQLMFLFQHRISQLEGRVDEVPDNKSPEMLSKVAPWTKSEVSGFPLILLRENCLS